MKKSLLALAVLGAYAGVASAQSSVTLYGTMDVGARYVKNDGSTRRLSLSTDGLNTSQLGFKGTEDLGGGLKAGFVLLSAIEADTGGAGSADHAQFYNRRATVSLWGNFGEVRLGRDYTPTGLNSYAFDVFGTNGVGDSTGMKQLAAPDYLRANNAIQYFLPTNLGGFYGGAMAAAGEGAAAGRYYGGRFGFAAGPFDVAAAYSDERLNQAVASRYKTASIGGSFDFGLAKIMGYFQQEKADTTLGATLPVSATTLASGITNSATAGTYASRGVLGLPRTNPRNDMYAISASIPVAAQGEVHIGATRSKFKADGGLSNGANKFAAGYVYNLSKRTAVYGTVAYLKNGSNSTLSVGSDTGANLPTVSSTQNTAAAQNAGGITAPPTAGGKSQGAEVGIRHFF